MRLILFDRIPLKNCNALKNSPVDYYRGYVFLLFLLIISILIYVLTPKQSLVSLPLFYTTFVLLVISLIAYFKTKKKNNYLDFDTIFITICCLIGFSTTFFYNEEYLYKALFLMFPFEDLYVNKGNLMFLIGMQSYFLGSLNRNKYVNRSYYPKRIINTQFLGVTIFILCFAFVASGGLSFYKGVYDESAETSGAGISIHILLLLLSCAIATIATEFYNKRLSLTYKFNKTVITSIGIMGLLLLYIGNRTAASQLFLPLVGLYAMLFHNLKFRQTLLLMLIGIFGMWLIQQTRSSTDINLGSSPVVIISDLTIPARNTYVSIDYVDRYGYTYGKTMLLGIVGVIPLAPSFVSTIIPLVGSAELLTDYTYDHYGISVDNKIGLGTTIIADIYLSFGMLGIILFMYFLGCFIDKYSKRAEDLNYYAIVIIAGMLANSVFIARASYTHPVRMVVWSLVIANINKHLFVRNEKNSSIHSIT